MNRNVYSVSNSWVHSSEIIYTPHPWLAIFITPAQVFRSLFHYAPYKGRFRLYGCWWSTAACQRYQFIDASALPDNALIQIGTVLIFTILFTWAWVNLSALNIFVGAKLFNLALDFDKLKIIVLWSILPMFVATLLALGSIFVLPFLQLPLLFIGTIYSALIFYSGMNQVCSPTYKALLAPLILPALAASVLQVI